MFNRLIVSRLNFHLTTQAPNHLGTFPLLKEIDQLFDRILWREFFVKDPIDRFGNGDIDVEAAVQFMDTLCPVVSFRNHLHFQLR